MWGQSAWRDYTTCNFNIGEANGTVCPHFFLFSVGFVRLSLTFSYAVWSVGLARLSLSHVFLPHATQQQCLDRPNPVWNINVDQAILPVCPKFDWSYWVLVMYLLSVGHLRLLSAFQEVCFSSQGPLKQQARWQNPSRNNNTGQADFAVRPHFFGFS